MKKIALLICVAWLFQLMACSDDDDTSTSQLPVEEAKQSLTDLSTKLTVDIIDIAESEGVGAVGDFVSLLNLNDPFGGRVASNEETKAWFKKSAALFRSVFISKSVGFSRTQDEGFSFEANLGEYNWNAGLGQFEKSPTSQSAIVINFPTEGSPENNATVRITAYAEQVFEDEFDHYHQPTTLAAELSINGVVQIALDFTAQYSTEGDPVIADVSLFLNPFTFNLAFNDTNSTQSSGSASILKGNDLIVDVELTLAYASSTKESIDRLSGFVQFRNWKVQGSVDVKGIDSAVDPDPNDYVDLEIFAENSKIGDLVFVTELVDGAEEDVPYVQYNDGSRQKLEDILQPVITEIEDLETEIETWG